MYIRARFTAVNNAYMCDYSGGTSMYVYTCIVITYNKGNDQPGIADPARGQQAERGK